MDDKGPTEIGKENPNMEREAEPNIEKNMALVEESELIKQGKEQQEVETSEVFDIQLNLEKAKKEKMKGKAIEEATGREEKDEVEVNLSFKGFCENQVTKEPEKEGESRNARRIDTRYSKKNEEKNEKCKNQKQNKDDECKKCRKLSVDSMISCDDCKKWLCQICTGLSEEDMEYVEEETKTNKQTKSVPGLKWICSICWTSIIKSERMIKEKLKEIKLKEDENEKLKKEKEKTASEKQKINEMLKKNKDEMKKLIDENKKKT